MSFFLKKSYINVGKSKSSEQLTKMENGSTCRPNVALRSRQLTLFDKDAQLASASLLVAIFLINK